MLSVPKWALAGALVAATAAASVGLAFASGDAGPEAPNTIICTQTGEEISRDDCPLVDPDRPDCPGKIECPSTGELVCRDRCPLDGESQADADDDVRPCCKRD